MRVELLAHTPDADMLCAYAAHLCYSTAPFDADRSAGILRKVCGNGHLSVLEHASFTFLVEGLSRAASHQLVRHLLAAYSQLSLRVTKGQPGFVSPPAMISDTSMSRLTWNTNVCSQTVCTRKTRAMSFHRVLRHVWWLR